jgi:hypothetical protein
VQFLDFIMALAPEGETMLFVRQKPQLRGGERQYHADGAIKATWPAYLPSHGVREGEAWYGNTASFIVDRFEDGRVSASSANCEYCAVMVLDDIGTKSKTPPLPPTWIMETSPGNYQYGYVFSEQPPKGEFAAAVKAIAAAGYTDPGACNPVRNFRLPGSVNLKPNRAEWGSILTEFHPDREFTLADICAALDVTPGPAESSGPRPIRMADDGADDVLVWLSGQGLLLSRPNAEGWAGVICPNSAEHTDGNPEGRYMPLNRAFCCMHGHCVDLDSNTYMQWVADNGGPRHAPGLRDELMAAHLELALAKIRPSPEYPDAAAEVIAEVERKELGRVEKAKWYQRFAYLQDDEAFFDMQDRRELSRNTFNALFRHIKCVSVHSTGKSARRVEASVCFDENRQAAGAKSLVGITYAAGESVLVTKDGLVYGNRWRDARPPTVACDISIWLRHLERMVPLDFEREHLLNVLAHKVQFPGHKINHAVLLGGKPGSGKDTLLAPFFWAVGGAAKLNCSLVKNEDLTSQWGYGLECEVMEIAELRQSEARDRRALENHLKPVIAAPPEYLPVNRKGLHPYMALNRVLVVAFSNERVSISLPSDDRRWFVLWAAAERLPEVDAVALWNWYTNRNGFAGVAAWLAARDVSAFNPSAPPPMTEAKAIMVEAGMSTAESVLVEMMRERRGPFAQGVIGSPFHIICDRVQGSGAAPPGVKIVQGALFHAFREAGWLDMGLIHSRDFNSKKHIFVAPELVSMTRSEMRRTVA